MAQDAELKLKVSLDLGFFRQQLAGLGQAAAGYNLPVKIKFDRSFIQNELNALGANIRRRNYRLTIETNLSAEIAKAETLARKLGDLSGKLKTGGGSFAGSQQGAAGLMEYMRSQGLSGGGGFVGVGRSTRLQNALEDLTVKQLQGLAKSEAITGVSRLKKSALIDKLMSDLSQQAMESILGNAQMMLGRSGGGGGSSSGAAWRQFLQEQAARPRGSRAYTTPIGPLPMGSKEPWAAEGGGYTPRMISSVYQRPAQLPSEGMLAPYRANPSYADPNSFLAFSRRASQIQGRIGGGGAVPAGGFPSEGMMYPSSQLPVGYNALGTLPEKLKQASEFLNRRQLPLTEGIKNLASEFGNATTQVLLFGTAYKALAFITSLPGQAFNAAKGLETFKNQLEAVTQSTGQFGPSLKFINDTVSQLNIPINSAREGFTRLFASLQPAGFDPKTIQNLFSGITKASATFGLSADQVDRVFYAFGQMASKGQVMSEELKGQLGDVLPGSVALFAEAAQMSMTDFTKALEDGMFKGDAMRVLLENVAVLMSTKFSDASAKASKTLQGQMNAMQNSMQLMYESLQPIVNSLAATFGPVIQKIIQDATDVVTAFNLNLSIGGDSFELMSEGAQNAYQALSQLVPSIQATFQNIGRFTEALKPLGSMLGIVIKAGLDFLSIPFVARLAAYSVIIGTLTTAFQFLVNTGIIQAIAAMIRFIATLSVTQIQAMIAGLQSVIAVLITMVKTLDLARLGVMALKVSLVTLGVGAVILGLDLVAQKLLGIGDSANKARQSAAALTDELNRAVEAGDTAVASAKYVEAEAEVQSIQQAQKVLQKLKGGQLQISQAEYQKLQGTGLAAGINYKGGIATFGQGQLEANIQAAQQGYVNALNKAGQAQEAMSDATQVALNRQRQTEASRANLKPIPPGGGEGGDGGGRKKIVSELGKQYQKALEEKKLYIEADASLSDRGKQLQIAYEEWRYGRAIATAEYNDKINAENTKNIANITQYLQQQKDLYDKENRILDQRYENLVTKPLRDMLDDERMAQVALAGSIQSLNAGREEQTQVEKRTVQINQALVGLTDEQKKSLKPLIDLILQEAAATDKLTAEQKRANEERRKRNALDEKIKSTAKQLREEIALLRARSEEERKRLRINEEFEGATPQEKEQIFQLQKVRDNIKQVRELIDDFVTSTSSDYKGFLKAVISGEDAADALQQFQEGLSDRVLTIFLDFTMKPVEDFFKNVAGGKLIESLFPKSEEEKQKEAIKTPMDANTEATKTNTTAIDNLTAAISGTGGAAASPTGLQSNIFSAYAQGAPSFVSMDKSIFQSAQSFASQGGGNGPLSAFAYETTGFADSLNQTVDSIKTTTENSKAAGTGFVESLGGVVQGIGMLAGAAMGIVGGIQQIQKGGTKNTLAGIGSILMGVGGAIGGFMNLGKMGKAANGAVWQGGFQAFANGGMVSGPTLGLIGEGKYNEAIVPLPNGKAIPVQLNSDSIREKMSGSSNGGSVVSPMLSMNFETTTINNVEYVSRDQLERAMMETRKLATRDGARQGANLAIDKLQQSPTTRRKIGI